MCNLFGLTEEKKCSACGIVKPKDMFSFYKRKDRPAIKYEHRCKDCKKRYDVERNMLSEKKPALRANRAKWREKKRQIKKDIIKANGVLDSYIGSMSKVAWCRCSKCSTLAYYKHKQLITGRPIGALDAGMCKKCYRSMIFKGSKVSKKQLTCIDCGGVTTGTMAKKRCNECSNKRSTELDRIKRSMGERMDRSVVDRAKKHGVHIDKVNRVRVYERDGWACYLCGISVVRSKTYRPDQATLDHIIPLSAGGPHTYDNVKTCCHKCNSDKADRLGVSSILHLVSGNIPARPQRIHVQTQNFLWPEQVK